MFRTPPSHRGNGTLLSIRTQLARSREVSQSAGDLVHPPPRPLPILTQPMPTCQLLVMERRRPGLSFCPKAKAINVYYLLVGLAKQGEAYAARGKRFSVREKTKSLTQGRSHIQARTCYMVCFLHFHRDEPHSQSPASLYPHPLLPKFYHHQYSPNSLVWYQTVSQTPLLA